MAEQKALIKSKALKDVLAQPAIKSRLAEILGQRAPQFSAALVQIQARSFQLSKCDPMSILGAAITAASLDLSVDPQLGEAHLVPYKERCTFQLGYIGLGQLAMRSGQYKRLGWAIVHAGELINYDELSGDLEINRNAKVSDEVIGYAAKFTLLNGFERAEYWTKAECLDHAQQYSQAYRAGVKDASKRDSPWWTDFDRMALKTVLKSLLRTWGPKSIESRIREALVADEAAIDVEGQVQAYPDNGAEAEPGLSKPELPAETKTEPKTKPVKGTVIEPTPTPAPAAPEEQSSGYQMGKAVIGLAKAKGVTEPEIMAALRELNVAENEKSVAELQPNVLQMLHDDINSICQRIVDARKAATPPTTAAEAEAAAAEQAALEGQQGEMPL